MPERSSPAKNPNYSHMLRPRSKCQLLECCLCVRRSFLRLKWDKCFWHTAAAWHTVPPFPHSLTSRHSNCTRSSGPGLKVAGELYLCRSQGEHAFVQGNTQNQVSRSQQKRTCALRSGLQSDSKCMCSHRRITSCHTNTHTGSLSRPCIERYTHSGEADMTGEGLLLSHIRVYSCDAIL